jgi:diguanylate cyclase (GGDEF)-like protein
VSHGKATRLSQKGSTVVQNRDPSQAPDVFARPDVFAKPQVPVLEPARTPALALAAEPAFNPAAIMASIGEAPYEWSIESDVLAWGANATDVLMVGSLAAISSGRNYAKLLPADATASRFDAVMKSAQTDEGAGVPYQVQYAVHPSGAEKGLWIEDIGRWFAGADGKPKRAHGIVRVINERHDQEERLTYLSRFDGLTGEMNRFHLTEVLETTLKQALAQRNSCGFMLVAVDNLARINESYGFDVADEAIGAVAKRLRAKMRGGDQLGRFSGNKFGIILNNCTPDDMLVAADRLLAGVRDEVVQTAIGPVAATMTIGGVTAPRHARSVEDIISRSQDSLDLARTRRHGSFCAYQPSVDHQSGSVVEAGATLTLARRPGTADISLTSNSSTRWSSRRTRPSRSASGTTWLTASRLPSLRRTRIRHS